MSVHSSFVNLRSGTVVQRSRPREARGAGKCERTTQNGGIGTKKHLFLRLYDFNYYLLLLFYHCSSCSSRWSSGMRRNRDHGPLDHLSRFPRLPFCREASAHRIGPAQARPAREDNGVGCLLRPERSLLCEEVAAAAAAAGGPGRHRASWCCFVFLNPFERRNLPRVTPAPAQ